MQVLDFTARVINLGIGRRRTMQLHCAMDTISCFWHGEGNTDIS